MVGVAIMLGLGGVTRSGEPVDFSVGKGLLDKYRCQSCHQPYEAGNAGPSLHAIAQKYADDPHAREDLADAVVNGSAGAWGDVAMTGYDVPPSDLHQLVDWILSLQH